VGDDSLELPLPARAAELLRAAARKTPTRFMHGNRDFLVARRFAEATGVELVADPVVLDLYGTRTLLMHGDTLCTDDHAYQAFREKVRDARWQAAALAQPLGERIAIAQQMRVESEGAKQGKATAIMDVNGEAVARAFRESGASLLIHGHTHRPGRHVHTVDGRECVRWVLPDWYEGGGYLAIAPEGVRAIALD
jgi:UDP-2,3-diacylglucosamine hydrolase